MNFRYPILTIGHSNQSAERFCEILVSHRIEVLLDVRSAPFSRHAPQFNQPSIAGWSEQRGIRYVFAGKSLGGRPADPSLYERGQVSYRKMEGAPSFVSALRRLARVSRTARCALVCVEADPLECHRFLLIAKTLVRHSIDARHILSDGTIESHEAGERRLVLSTGLAQSELFQSYEAAVEAAYALQEARFAFRKPLESESESWLEVN
jgi:uncharacterized protein (DUF488 family)